MSIDSSPGLTEPTPVPIESGGDTSATKPMQEKEEEKQENQQSTLLPTSILSSLCAPFSNLLSGPTSTSAKESSPQNSESANDTPTLKEARAKDEEEDKEPEPYYKPNEVPTFKALQKKRLSGTRTKQLLRAAGRAYNDPPPPPELGTCCGSSCDPCVNDLWREERNVWRERWGDRRVEGEYAEGRKELEW
ncbi:uncharacterized protein N7503_008129 [Penicillium pulvis]|uniref:uncharacterized protein n=1 Tax=Penicillium pulvis TaxID=1562058 RepID=UPI002547B859|nr:uncharacterized protein N7503_008129 [Penicillium pulvis]KAJ5792151.1 hypothetical protein N7503_008129 [Penicillium pulvis]